MDAKDHSLDSETGDVPGLRTVTYQRPPPPSLVPSQYHFIKPPVTNIPGLPKSDSSLRWEYEGGTTQQMSSLDLVWRQVLAGTASAAFTQKKTSSMIPYTILDNKHLRLISIMPSAYKSSAIVCAMHHSHVDHRPIYTAISYAWGDRRDTTTISLTYGHHYSGSISVTSSLRDVLRALRHPTKPVTVWVDALSINQSDKDELSRQVQIMDSIYHNADYVALWLGPSSDNSTLAIQTLRQIGTETTSLDSNKDVESVATSTSSTAISAIIDLFERDYWKRLWIVQEVFFSKRAVLYCGDDHVEWREIAQALALFNSPEWKRAINGIYPPGGTHSRGSRQHYSFAQVMATQGPQSLLYQQCTSGLPPPITVMRHTRNKLAARPEDKVLGVISLLGHNIRSTILPDFNLVPREIFPELVISIIQATGSLDIICEAIYYPYHRDVFDLPSWVADWSHAPDISALAATNLEHREPFKASGYITYCNPGKPENKQDGSTVGRDELAIQVMPLGTIASRGMAVGTLGRLTNYLMAFLEWRQLLIEEFEDEGGNERQAFCRTLCLGDVPPSIDLGFGSLSLKDGEWTRIFYNLFSMFLVRRLGKLPLDPALQECLNAEPRAKESEGRAVLQQYFGDRVMGRCFCVLAHEGEYSRAMGMGTGCMAIGDSVVVARGCSTPIILRSTGKKGRFEFVGDIYVDGYMDGEALVTPGNTWESVVLC